MATEITFKISQEVKCDIWVPVLLLVEKKIKAIFQVSASALSPRMEYLHTKKVCNGSNFGWLIQQMSINQKSEW